MAYPTGVVLRTLTSGDSSALAGGEPLITELRVRPSRGLTYDGHPMPAHEEVIRSALGEQASIELPVCDQSGHRDALTGAIIDVSAEGAVTHTYRVLIRWLTDGDREVSRRTIAELALPTEDLLPVDADALVDVPTVAGTVISVPDSWSALVAQAVAAAGSADAAAASAAAADADRIAAEAAASSAAGSASAASGSASLAADARAAAEQARDDTNALDLDVTATTLAPGSPATATVSGTLPNLTLELGVPEGEQGDTGPANTLTIGTVTTLPAGASATAEITGTPPTQTLNLGLVSGQPSDWLKVGPGDPRAPATTSGQITGSEPNGCMYRSTDGGGVGGYLWTKRGGVWVCEAGDTGWRDVTTLIENPTSWSIGQLALRRVNSDCILRVHSLASLALDGVWRKLLTLQAGWRTGSANYTSSATLASAGGSNTTTHIQLAGYSGGSGIRFLTTPATAVSGELRWSTPETWLTSLPGTAA